MITVDHYGLHRADGNIAFLMQADGSSTNALGLTLHCPFEVVSPSRCNHQITLDASSFKAPTCSENALVKAMSPVPKRTPYPIFVPEGRNPTSTKEVLKALCEMSAYLTLPMIPLWNLSRTKARKELNATNVQPLVVTDVKPTDRQMVDLLIDMAILSPRQLVLVCSNEVFLGSNVIKIHNTLTSYDVSDTNWRAVGREILRKEMHKS